MGKKGGKFQSIGDLLREWDVDKKKYITREFQDYGYRLAMELQDEHNKSLYIKLAKEEDRKLLEEARTFVKDAMNVRSKAKLFMWALSKLRRGEPLYDSEDQNTPSNTAGRQRTQIARSSERSESQKVRG